MVVDLERMVYSEVKPVEMTTLEHIVLGCEVICSQAQGIYRYSNFLAISQLQWQNKRYYIISCRKYNRGRESFRDPQQKRPMRKRNSYSGQYSGRDVRFLFSLIEQSSKKAWVTGL